MTVEIATNGKELLFVARRRTAPIAGLSPKQLEWCAANLKGFAWPRVSRLADHERANAAYRLAELIDEARDHIQRSV